MPLPVTTDGGNYEVRKHTAGCLLFIRRMLVLKYCFSLVPSHPNFFLLLVCENGTVGYEVDMGHSENVCEVVTVMVVVYEVGR
jgi:hypothetical protein